MNTIQWLFEGAFDLPWWGLVIVALALTHITIAGVTIYLHRHQAHRALDLHAIPSHFFRFWLWMTTGMITKEWTSIHRKHHAKCETAEDPHSPQIYGINRVLWGGVILYVQESRNAETMERYGHGTPDDWLERNIYSRFPKSGIATMAIINMLAFGVIPGMLIFGVQMLWIPFWAAGVINGVGHWFGYRSFDCEDASRNIVPWGILIGGEELHNNHHAFASSAKLSNKWYEFDVGWMYICILEVLGLASVKKVAPTPRLASAKATIDLETLQAVITHRYHVLSSYASSLKVIYRQEMNRLGRFAPGDAAILGRLKGWLHRDHHELPEATRARLAEALAKSKSVATVVSMRSELAALWQRSSDSRDQLVRQLEDWCRRAEGSGILPLVQFSHRLRRYV